MAYDFGILCLKVVYFGCDPPQSFTWIVHLFRNCTRCNSGFRIAFLSVFLFAITVINTSLRRDGKESISKLRQSYTQQVQFIHG